VIPFFAFSPEVRRINYTTNAILSHVLVDDGLHSVRTETLPGIIPVVLARTASG
jgi:transposase-like protein